jgi:hypothetical protein
MYLDNYVTQSRRRLEPVEELSFTALARQVRHAAAQGIWPQNVADVADEAKTNELSERAIGHALPSRDSALRQH